MASRTFARNSIITKIYTGNLTENQYVSSPYTSFLQLDIADDKAVLGTPVFATIRGSSTNPKTIVMNPTANRIYVIGVATEQSVQVVVGYLA